MERVQHLADSLRHMLFDRHPRTESSRILGSVEYYRHHLAPRNALVQSLANLAHHGDIENIERRPRERDPRHAVGDVESDALIFLRHLATDHLIEEGLATVISLNRLKSRSLNVSRWVTLCAD